MRRCLGPWLLALSTPIVLVAQSERVATCGSSTAMPASLQFRDVGRVVSTIALADTGRSAVLGARSVDFAPDGRVLLTDGRQRKVLLFDPQLRSSVSIGREGEGPGEFRAPRQAVFGPDGSISVLDMALARVVEFDRSGRFRRAVRMPTADPRAIALLAGGDYLVAGNNLLDGRDRLLTRAGPDSKVAWVAVPTDTILRAINLIVDAVWMVQGATGEAIVGLSVSPAVWRVRHADGAVLCRTAIPGAFWRQLSTANRPRVQTMTSMRQWIEGATLVMAATRTAAGRLLVTTNRGGEGVEVREWIVFDTDLVPVARVSGVPGPAVATRGDTLVVVGEDQDGRTTVQRIVLSLWRLR